MVTNLKFTGGFDKDGFAMKNGIIAQGKKKFYSQKVVLYSDLERDIIELV